MREHVLDVELEQLVDKWGIHTLLCSLERVCNEKAAYVAEGGSHGEPSTYMARQWSNTADRIGRAQNTAAGL